MYLLRRNSQHAGQPGYGDAVALWQQFLIGQGLDHPVVNGTERTLTADRDYGPTTEQASKDFQVAHDQTPDGVVGQDTVDAAVALGFAPGPDPVTGRISLSADQIADMKAAFDEFGITDPTVRAAIVAINIGESGMRPRSEDSYSGTGNDHIRGMFGSRVADLSDDDLDRIKASDVSFFNLVYGGDFGRRNLGNTQDGDGFKYRGRGLNQLTGRGNYARYSTALGNVDLIADPDLANDMATAARISVAFMKDKVHPGSTWEDMKRAVGKAVASTEAEKDAAFAKLQADRTFV